MKVLKISKAPRHPELSEGSPFISLGTVDISDLDVPRTSHGTSGFEQ